MNELTLVRKKCKINFNCWIQQSFLHGGFMKNKSVAICLSLVLLLGASTLSFAETSPETLKTGYKDIKSTLKIETDLTTDQVIILTEATVDGMIQIAQLEADLAMTSLSGKELEAELDKIIKKLLDLTYGAVTLSIDYAADQNVELERTWVPVAIGDRVVLVDPIRSVRY